VPEKCHVIGCNTAAIAKGLCDKHRKRVARQGHSDQTRAKDWGSRTAHPAYKSWQSLNRYYKPHIPKTWANDFWQFVADVPPKPDGRCSICRLDNDKPFGPDNFYWRQSRLNADELASKAAYMREYQRTLRAANPEYGKNGFLKRRYGVSIEWYEEALAKQGGVCAICKKPESLAIKGQTVALAVDHDHATGKARGLLCKLCNTGLGVFQDDPNLLAKAADYLLSYPQCS